MIKEKLQKKFASKLANRRSDKKHVSLQRSEALLNEAYELLNSTELQVRSLPLELSEILTASLQFGVKFYLQANLAFKNGQLFESANLSKSAIHLSQLISDLAEKEIENVLLLPTPPKMKIEKPQVLSRKGELFPGLATLETILQRKLKTGTQFENKKLNEYPIVLAEASKYLWKIKSQH